MIEKIKNNKLYSSLMLVFATAAACMIISVLVWNYKLGENGAGTLLRNNRYFGKSGIDNEEIVQIESEKDYSFNFVAYENLQDLSIYVKPNSAEGTMSVSLLTGGWLPLMSTTVNFADIEQDGFYKLFGNIEIPNSERQVLILNVTDIKYDNENKIELCSTSTGATALYSSTENKELLHIFMIVTALLSAMVIAAVFCIFNKVAVHTMFICLAIPAVIVYSILLYPGTACDEPSHYMSAYKLSNRYLGIDDTPYSPIMRQTDAELLKDRWESPNIEGVHLSAKNFLHRTDKTELVDTDYNSLIYHTPGNIYRFTAVFITIARLIGFNGFTTYYIGRFANILLYLLFGYIALKISRVGKWALFVLMFNPLVLNLCTSANQDGTILAIIYLTMGFWSYCSHITKIENRPMNRKEWLIFAVLEILLINCKVYALFGLIFFAIPNNNISFKNIKNKKRFAIFSLSSIVVVCAAAIIFLKTNTFYGEAVLKILNTNPDNQYYSVGYICTHFIQTITVLVKSLIMEGPKWFCDAFGNRVSWETYLSGIYGVISFIIAIVAAGIAERENKIDRKERFALLAIFIMFFLIVLARGLMWTHIAEPYIWLLTGRYFIPSLPMLFFGLQYTSKHSDTMKKIIPMAVAVFSYIYTVDLLINYMI